MKRMLPVDELARDERFSRIKVEDFVFDPRNAVARDNDRRGGFRVENEEAPDAARSLMHGIFVGEIQARAPAARAGTSRPATKGVTQPRSC